jgi:hypothetical protein
VWIGIAAAPVPTPEPRVEPLQAIRNDLAKDGHAVLLGPSGRPRHERWLIGGATVIEPTSANPAFAFEAPHATQLELLTHPGVEHYQVTAEFQLLYHKAIVGGGGKPAEVGLGDTAWFGLYCGDVPLATTDGHPVHLSMVAGYVDYFSDEVRAKRPKLQGLVALQTAAIVSGPDGPRHSPLTLAGKPLDVPLAKSLATPPRRVRIEVSPAGVKVFWSASPTAAWQLVGERTAAQITDDLRRKAAGLRAPLAAHQPPVWNPAGSCGVWCRGAAISVKNVDVAVLSNP